MINVKRLFCVLLSTVVLFCCAAVTSAAETKATASPQSEAADNVYDTVEITTEPTVFVTPIDMNPDSFEGADNVYDTVDTTTEPSVFIVPIDMNPNSCEVA